MAPILLWLWLGVGHLELVVLGGLSLLCLLGVDFRVKNLLVDNKTFALQLWDTAGQERYLDRHLQWTGTWAELRVWEERVAHKLGDRQGDKVCPH